MRFGPGGGTYRIVTTARETTGRHFAFEATEPRAAGHHAHARDGGRYYAVLDGEFTFYIDGRDGRHGWRLGVRASACRTASRTADA